MNGKERKKRKANERKGKEKEGKVRDEGRVE